jgi:molybdopterin-containing oxidoreductase family membrane subunit
VPNPLGTVTEYWPTIPEFFISIGIYAMGALIISVLYKVVLSVRGQVEVRRYKEIETGRRAVSGLSG